MDKRSKSVFIVEIIWLILLVLQTIHMVFRPSYWTAGSIGFFIGGLMLMAMQESYIRHLITFRNAWKSVVNIQRRQLDSQEQDIEFLTTTMQRTVDYKKKKEATKRGDKKPNDKRGNRRIDDRKRKIFLAKEWYQLPISKRAKSEVMAKRLGVHKGTMYRWIGE